MLKILAVTTLIAFSIPSHADTATNILGCKSGNLRTVDPGFACITTKGVVFKLISRTSSTNNNPKEVWQDLKTGVVIEDISNGRYTQGEAAIVCASGKGLTRPANFESVEFKLPSQDEFYTEENNGHAEVLPNLEDSGVWTTSRTSAYIDRYWLYHLNLPSAWSDFGFLTPLRCLGYVKPGFPSELAPINSPADSTAAESRVILSTTGTVCSNSDIAKNPKLNNSIAFDCDDKITVFRDQDYKEMKDIYWDVMFNIEVGADSTLKSVEVKYGTKAFNSKGQSVELSKAFLSKVVEGVKKIGFQPARDNGKTYTSTYYFHATNFHPDSENKYVVRYSSPMISRMYQEADIY